VIGLALCAALAVTGVTARRLTAGPGPEPRYRGADELVRPEGYASWVFVGASIGLSYSDHSTSSGPGSFHHVYINPEAYAEYVARGRFPEKTVLVMEVFKPEQKVSINKQGYFEGERVGLEVAVKDRSRFEDGWAYFDFANGARATARPFPRASCFECHQKHGAADNVFTQFYPVLRR
jgi:hypothetical protein